MIAYSRAGTWGGFCSRTPCSVGYRPVGRPLRGTFLSFFVLNSAACEDSNERRLVCRTEVRRWFSVGAALGTSCGVGLFGHFLAFRLDRGPIRCVKPFGCRLFRSGFQRCVGPNDTFGPGLFPGPVSRWRGLGGVVSCPPPDTVTFKVFLPFPPVNLFSPGTVIPPGRLRKKARAPPMRNAPRQPHHTSTNRSLPDIMTPPTDYAVLPGVFTFLDVVIREG